MISIKELHAGDGYRYLLKGVVADGEQMPGASTVTAYYTEAGNPPGRWLGSGLAALDDGDGLALGTQVSEEQMERLYRSGSDPITGEPLGRKCRVPTPVQDRIAARVAALPAEMPPDEQAAMAERIEGEERAKRVSRPVSGFDVTFSPPKSVSVMWALADHGVREQIYEAHRSAVADTIATIERDAARTRTGTDGVAQVETAGVIATAFDHWDSRAGDPQLHTHVVIANRVQGPDGKWRTLDSRGSLFPATVAMSELYDNLLADHITVRVGLDWRVRETPAKAKNAAWELDGVPDDLIAAFSTRANDIEREKDRLVADYRRRHGRSPRDTVVLRLRQIATLATRPVKEIRTLSEMTQHWRERAGVVLGHNPTGWAQNIIRAAGEQERRPVLLHADDVAVSNELDELARSAYTELATERTTWKTWNVRAAAARAAMRHRMVTTSEREKLIAAVTARVVEMSVDLTPTPAAHTPAEFTRHDGTSTFTRTHAGLFTSAEVLAAEERLLTASRARDSTTLATSTAEHILSTAPSGGHRLTDDQADAVRDITSSARRVDVFIGPAGAGKTTTLAALRAAWELDHGDGSVIGLAPSAAAADVLGESLCITTGTTAKWLHQAAQVADDRRELAHLDHVLRLLDDGDPAWRNQLATTGELSERAAAWATASGAHDPAAWTPSDARDRVSERVRQLRANARRWSLRPDQLIVVDEASLAGTLAVDELATLASDAGAKVLMVGDWAQLASVDAGGSFGMLTRDRGDGLAPELTGVRRFNQAWERRASMQLRLGDTAALDVYADHERLHGGETEDMLDAAYTAWLTDEQAGLDSLLIAGDNATVTELNQRARADRVTAGLVDTAGIALVDGTVAGTGDRVITRHNQRRLTTGSGWVKNGDTWQIVRTHRGGALTVRRCSGAGTITLPAAYVAEHVELAYATTAHRAQGATVDTAHAVVTGPSMTREVLYVAMTRARTANHAYVATDIADDDERHHRDPDTPPTTRSVLTTVLRRQGAELSAGETAHAETERARSITQIAAEYETLHRAAAADRHASLLTACAVDPGTVEDSEHLVSLSAAVRRADAYGLDTNTALPKLAAAQPIEPDHDSAKVLAARLARWTDHAMHNAPGGLRHQRRLAAGLVPIALGISDPDMQRALTEREDLLEQRARILAERAINTQAPWLRHLGRQPDEETAAAQWRRCVQVLAAYRERHDITDSASPAGEPGTNWTQRHDHRQATQAIEAALRIAGLDRDTPTRGVQQHQRTLNPERTL